MFLNILYIDKEVFNLFTSLAVKGRQIQHLYSIKSIFSYQASPIQYQILLRQSIVIQAIIIYHNLMQADYNILPKRPVGEKESFKHLNPIKFFTNYYDISLNFDSYKISQYSIALPQQVPQDSQLYHQAIVKNASLKKKIGYLAHSGQIIWGLTSINLAFTQQCSFTYQQNKYSYEAIIKKTKQFDLKDMSSQKDIDKYLQILNVNIINTLKSINLQKIGRQSQYYSKIQTNKQLQQKGLRVIKGFRFTLISLNHGIYLQIDVCSRVLQLQTLLQAIQKKNKDMVISMYTGKTVISNYGSHKTYKIQQFDFQKSPLSVFFDEKKGQTITFVQYYKNYYGKNIQDKNQPLIKVLKNNRKVYDKQKNILKQIKQYVYLIPELVSLTGMTDPQRQDRQTMKFLAPFTKLSPVQRVNECSKVIDKFNNVKGLININNQKKIQGYCLQKPNILFKSGNKIKPDNKGILKYRNPLREPFKFKNWVVLYSVPKNINPKLEQQNVFNILNLLVKSGQIYGVKFQNPNVVRIKYSQINQWKQGLYKQIQRNKNIQIIVILFDHYEQKLYDRLKRYITNQLKYPSQFIKKMTLYNPKGAMSAASKIIIQMNAKVGCVPWQVEKSHKFFKGKNIMYGACSISKNKSNHVFAFVGTINNECTRVYSSCKLLAKESKISVDKLKKILIEWAKNYFQNNNRVVPDTIIIYRQSLPAVQTKTELQNNEIPAIQEMVKQIGKRTKTQNYNPGIVIVGVNKNPNNRFYNTVNNSDQALNKFASNLINADSGSLILQQLSHDNCYDFHLAAQFVTQGTCTPTQYRVLYDTSRMPEQALVTFTYEQCFNYYNWQGAVRVPACFQDANKLSKLVGMYIKQDIAQSGLQNKHFFL